MIDIKVLMSLFMAIDYVIIIISFLIILFSLLRGFIQSILWLLTWVGSIFITIHFHMNLSDLISNQLSKNETLSQLLPINEISKYIISIPLVFFISLFVLKRIKKFISSDLNKNFIGTILDKFFGFIFGFSFVYILITTILVSPTIFEFEWLKNDVVEYLKNKSLIINYINELNSYIIPSTELINNTLEVI